MISFPLMRYVLMAAFRDRLMIALLILIVAGASLSVLLGSAAVVERAQFALVFAAGGMRLAGILGVVLFTVFYMRRAFETKDVDYLLTRPITRANFILSHAAAFSLLGVIFACMVVLAVFSVDPYNLEYGHYLWAGSLVVEYIIMANAALFFAMVLSSPAGGAMATLGFYVMARMIGQLLGVAALGAESPLFQIMHVTLKGVSMIIPRLDLMAQTSWLVYGAPDISAGFILVQGVIFTGLLVSAALVDLVRRQF